MDPIRNIVLIGAGNVATHLGMVLKGAGFSMVQVYSRTAASAQTLAEKLNTGFTADLNRISPDGDLYIISVSDHAIEKIIPGLKLNGSFIIHTSGSVSMDTLKPVSDHIGVLYPLQTFSKSREVDFREIPVCLEAVHGEDMKKLRQLTHTITKKTFEVNSDKRKVLHLAAVFACNFPNFMYSVAGDIIKKAGLDFNMLRPLITETAEKVMDANPGEVQTGPAVRHDNNILEKHMELLEDASQKKLYEVISHEIMKMNPAKG